jgi:tRNA A37 N6-isopentenylltransferase MiaA
VEREVIVITGPTASGKTVLSIETALGSLIQKLSQLIPDKFINF